MLAKSSTKQTSMERCCSRWWSAGCFSRSARSWSPPSSLRRRLYIPATSDRETTTVLHRTTCRPDRHRITADHGRGETDRSSGRIIEVVLKRKDCHVSQGEHRFQPQDRTITCWSSRLTFRTASAGCLISPARQWMPNCPASRVRFRKVHCFRPWRLLVTSPRRSDATASENVVIGVVAVRSNRVPIPVVDVRWRS